MVEAAGDVDTRATEGAGARAQDCDISAPARALEYSVDIRNLSKRFRRRTVGRGGYTTLKSAMLGALRACNVFARAGHDDQAVNYTTVLRDLTLRIPRGASVGVIGKNGSGKSSFLKLLTGIYRPDAGSVEVRGRLAALIELGAGFHPDFSGRENVYLGGIMYGLSRAQIDERFAKIVRFAELEEVIDDPVRTYSSGMFMRLGFSLAVHTDPDILLIDEVLAVGDAAFHAKCRDHLAGMRRAGKTLVLVSHDLDAVERWSDEVLWLHGGEVRDRGEPRRVIDHYRQFIEAGEESEILGRENAPGAIAPAEGTPPPSESICEPQRWGSREIEVTSVALTDEKGAPRRVFHPESTFHVTIGYRLHQSVTDIVFGVGITRNDGVLVHGTNTAIERVKLPSLGSRGTVSYEISRLGLLDGNYRLDVACHRADGYPYDYHQGALEFSVRSSEGQVGVFLPEHRWQFASDG